MRHGTTSDGPSGVSLIAPEALAATPDGPRLPFEVKSLRLTMAVGIDTGATEC